MTFVSGPRQAGKTTFAKDVAAYEPASLYFNYDIHENKAKIIKNPTFFEMMDRKEGEIPLIILDEIHKYSDWKNYLKGIYDGYSGTFRFLITGSGRLDLSRKRGDSLAGRYLHFRLYPFTIGELFASSIGPDKGLLTRQIPEPHKSAEEAWKIMSLVSGFPEPYLKGKKISYRRWSQTYHSQVIRDDIRDEFAVKQIDKMESLYSLLSDFVGNPFSVATHSRNLKISHKTVTSWLTVFERFFLIFGIRPYSKSISRSLLKEQKIYYYDYCRVNEDAFRFENMVAVELNRAVNLWSDFGLGKYELWYLRNKEKEEVDFLVTENAKPFFMVDIKLSDATVSPHIIKFQNQLKIPAIQLVNKPHTGRKIKNGKHVIIVVSAASWLANLN